VLDEIASGVEQWLRTKQIHPSFLDPAEHGGGDQGLENRSARVKQIISELHYFILETGPEFHALILAGQDGTDRLIRHAFKNHLLDGARKVGVDPWRYLYKRARQVLRQSGRFQNSLKSGRFFMFSLEAGAVSLPPLTEEEIESISFPAEHRLDFKKVCKEGTLTPLAEHFWRQASGMRAANLWVDLRDFVNWVFLHVVAPGVELDGGDAEEGGAIENTSAPEEEGGEHTARPEAALLAAETRKLAACFAGRLEPEMRAVMYYRDVLELDWKEIARRTGHSGPSGPSYTYKTAQDRMKAFIRDLQKLSPEDFNPKDFRLFCETLRQILKESQTAP
jgi:hypothetical protein